MNKETQIQNAILLALSEAGALSWRHQVGTFRAYDNPNRLIKIGTPGQADIMAILPVIITDAMVGTLVGLSYQIEVKTSTGKQSEGQKNWQKQTENRGAIYQLARDPAEVLATLRNIGGKLSRQ